MLFSQLLQSLLHMTPSLELSPSLCIKHTAKVGEASLSLSLTLPQLSARTFSQQRAALKRPCSRQADVCSKRALIPRHDLRERREAVVDEDQCPEM